MDYEEAKAKIEAMEGGAVILEVIRKNASTEANTEAKGLRTRLRTLEGSVRKLAGAEDSEKIEDAISRLEQGLQAGGSSDERTKRLEKSLEDLKGQLAQKDKEFIANKARGKLKDALTAAKAKSKGIDDAVRLLEGETVAFDGDDLMFEGKDGAMVPAKAFLDSWLKDRPHFIESSQQPGPGAEGTRNQTPGGQKTITRADYDKAQASRDKATLDAVGTGKITISD